MVPKPESLEEVHWGKKTAIKIIEPASPPIRTRSDGNTSSGALADPPKVSHRVRTRVTQR